MKRLSTLRKRVLLLEYQETVMGRAALALDPFICNLIDGDLKTDMKSKPDTSAATLMWTTPAPQPKRFTASTIFNVKQ